MSEFSHDRLLTVHSVSGRSPASAETPGRLSSVEAHDESRAGRAAHLADLLNRCARGYEEAFAELYDLTSTRIHGLILRVLRAPDLASEVTQEVYVEIWRHSARYDSAKGSALAWMTSLAHRRAVDRVRSVEAERDRDHRWTRLNVEPETDRVWEEVDRGLNSERVRRGMETLTPVQREALTLAYFGGYSQSQVAGLLSLPLGTVKTRIRDALIKLRDAWGVET